MTRGKKYKVLVRIYALAGVLTLSLYAWVNTVYLERWRQTAAYSAALAFEETVRAAESLSEALEESVYATDGAMCARLCGDVYAACCAAESAMATLPFDTQELERLSAFLNQAGDYARTLCRESAEAGFEPGQAETLRSLSQRAGELLATLEELRGQLNGGALRMDSREKRLRNVGEEPGEALSARLLRAEADFASPGVLHYDGQYGKTESSSGYLTEEEMRELAARFLGAEPEALEKTYTYEGLEGRRCFRWGDSFLCVSRSGVESLSQTRLVSEPTLTEEEAEELARRFLRERGYGELKLMEKRVTGAVLALRYARIEDRAIWLDNTLSIAVALDDGSIYSFNADAYTPGESGVHWRVDEATAAAALPASFELEESRRVITTSEGGRNCGCFEFSGTGRGGEQVRICVSAEDGKQCRITVEK